MDKLRQQAARFSFIAWVVTASSYFFLFATFPFVKEWASVITLLGVSWTIIPFSVVLFYEKYGWRYVNRDVDLVGYWDFGEDQFKWDKDGGEAFDYAAWGHMRVVQDTKSIHILDGQTFAERKPNERPLEIARWWSDACDLNASSGTITAALNHEPAPLRVGGAIKYGVEVFTITQRYRGKPICLSSTVYHCIGYGEPRIVACKYVRRGYSHLVEEPRPTSTP